MGGKIEIGTRVGAGIFVRTGLCGEYGGRDSEGVDEGEGRSRQGYR